MAARLHAAGAKLASGWDGNAGNRFLTPYYPQPRGSGADAGFTADKASEIASLRVTIWETVWEEVEVPG